MNVKNAVPAPGRVRKMYCVTICCVISVTYIAFFVYHVNLYHVCEFVEYVLTVLVYLLHNEEHVKYFTENILILLCNIFFVLLMPCIHGVAAEQTAGEVDKIKLILLEHSVKDIDDREKNEARLFLRYSDLRAFRVRVWRTFAVDANLPIALISLYTTYFIILVQLTHLYD
ncbi:hypothetical protein EVAR_48567_1 [Eumeta japonica]|uniref:Gustatory receptor n=1 Tax=Eumeta variegata TaxID=151549 RepID=A0A4C1XCB9_EUMVA|nr:hypothetical protein EVAR_48567_1 [Eumeta japonica]